MALSYDGEVCDGDDGATLHVNPLIAFHLDAQSCFSDDTILMNLKARRFTNWSRPSGIHCPMM